MKVWNITHNGHVIRVEGSWFTGERLFIDGELQDEQRGCFTRSRLYGTVRSPDVPEQRVKVSLGGWFALCCSIFVADRLVYSGS